MAEVGLMKNRAQYIEKVIHSIDWRKIKSYYRKLGIRWEYQEDKETVQRTPTVADLKDEFRSILGSPKHVHWKSFGL